MHGAQGLDARLGRQLVLDELFDLTLYQSLLRVAPPALRPILEQLIPIETRHYGFWQEFFGLKITTLDLPRRLKLALLVGLARLLGAPGIHLILEAIEVYGVRKYLAVWRRYEGGPLGAAIRGILEDEFKHEDAVVMADSERQVSPQRVRDIFLGLNDGLVEILGAVSGFFGAFTSTTTVLVAGIMVGVAGAFSMGAGAYLAGSSEAEVRDTEVRRRRFLGEAEATEGSADTPLAAGVWVRGELRDRGGGADPAGAVRRPDAPAVPGGGRRCDRHRLRDPRLPLRHERQAADPAEPGHHGGGGGDQLPHRAGRPVGVGRQRMRRRLRP